MISKSRNAVVGVDLGCTGDDALMEGLAMIRSGFIAKLHLLYVIDPKAYQSGFTDTFDTAERALELAPARLEQRALTLCRVHGVTADLTRVRGHARIGDVAETLSQMCVDYDAHLLIVGTHGRTGLDRWLDGSVAESALRRARCPVLVARPVNYEGAAKTVLPDLPYAPGEAPRREEHEDAHVQPPTTLDSWEPSDNGPTGFRIV